MRTCKSDGALGDDPLLEVLKSGFFPDEKPADKNNAPEAKRSRGIIDYFDLVVFAV